MRITDRSVIARPPAEVWPFVASADNYRLWNPKLRFMDARGPFMVGHSFATRYLFNGKEIQFLTTVVAVDENRFLELRHDSVVARDVRSDLRAQERIALSGFLGRTTVTRTLAFHDHAIAWYWVLLIQLINALGHRVGPDPLKELCERGMG